MEKRSFQHVTVVVLLSLCIALFAACAVYGGIKANVGAVVIMCVMAIFSLLCLLGIIRQGRLCAQIEKLLPERRFREAKDVLDRAMKNYLLFPFMRISLYSYYIVTAAALDDLPLAEKYIDRLRHGGGPGWKYKTAYLYILIKLDEGDVKTAQAEYADFRHNNEKAEIYRQQIEVLDAVFSRLFSRSDEPLPEAAVNSFFPVLHRILGKHFERQAATSAEDWSN